MVDIRVLQDKIKGRGTQASKIRANIHLPWGEGAHVPISNYRCLSIYVYDDDAVVTIGFEKTNITVNEGEKTPQGSYFITVSTLFRCYAIHIISAYS